MHATAEVTLDETTLDQVVQAGQLLFGAGFGVPAQGFPDALRAAYRRRALETHPDRAHSLGRTESELASEFRAVADAYRVLSTFERWPAAQVRRSRPRPVRAEPRARHAAAEPVRPMRPPRARVHEVVSPVELPRRRLRLAEYLYYAGRVPWSAFVEAIAWQRGQRPPIGRVAVDFGFLAPEDVRSILERRRREGATATPFGEYAVSAGFLTPFQLLASLGRQLRLQRRIGTFFVERGLLAEEDLHEARRRLSRHNASHPAAPGRDGPR